MRMMFARFLYRITMLQNSRAIKKLLSRTKFSRERATDPSHYKKAANVN